MYRTQGEAVGLGSVQLAQIEPDLTNRMGVASYVLGQHESVFGTTKHRENSEHPKGKRRLLMPHDATLKEHVTAYALPTGGSCASTSRSAVDRI